MDIENYDPTEMKLHRLVLPDDSVITIAVYGNNIRIRGMEYESIESKMVNWHKGIKKDEVPTTRLVPYDWPQDDNDIPPIRAILKLGVLSTITQWLK